MYEERITSTFYNTRLSAHDDPKRYVFRRSVGPKTRDLARSFRFARNRVTRKSGTFEHVEPRGSRLRRPRAEKTVNGHSFARLSERPFTRTCRQNVLATTRVYKRIYLFTSAGTPAARVSAAGAENARSRLKTGLNF